VVTNQHAGLQQGCMSLDFDWYTNPLIVTVDIETVYDFAN